MVFMFGEVMFKIIIKKMPAPEGMGISTALLLEEVVAFTASINELLFVYFSVVFAVFIIRAAERTFAIPDNHRIPPLEKISGG